MNLCSDNHEEICYDGGSCPLCVLADDLNQQILELNEELNEALKIIGENTNDEPAVYARSIGRR